VGQKKCAIDQWPKHITVVIQAQKVMSSYTVSNYWPHCVQRKPPVFNLLRGRFWSIRPAGATRCTDGGEIWHGEGTEGPLPC